jgi:uncharacterized membrane protein YfcA
MLYAFLLLCGASVGFLSGLLGIGGGIVMFPLLYYLTPALGFEPIDVRSLTGLTMAQGFFASLSAMLFYSKNRLVNRPLVLTLGLSLLLSSLTGAVASSRTPEGSILFIFGLLALTASAMMFIPRSYEKDNVKAAMVGFNRPLAVAVGVPLGFFLGLLGQGGAFIIIPMLLYVLKIPLRVTLGSTLAIGLFSSSAGLAGKAATGQVPFLMAGALLLGAVPAAWLGGIVGKKTRPRALRWMLAIVVAASAVKIWMDIFQGGA